MVEKIVNNDYLNQTGIKESLYESILLLLDTKTPHPLETIVQFFKDEETNSYLQPVIISNYVKHEYYNKNDNSCNQYLSRIYETITLLDNETLIGALEHLCSQYCFEFQQFYGELLLTIELKNLSFESFVHLIKICILGGELLKQIKSLINQHESISRDIIFSFLIKSFENAQGGTKSGTQFIDLLYEMSHDKYSSKEFFESFLDRNLKL